MEEAMASTAVPAVELNAEIARLEAELGVMAPYEYAAATMEERPALQRIASQQEYVVVQAPTTGAATNLLPQHAYPESDDEFSADLCSYDEITVDSSDMLLFESGAAAANATPQPQSPHFPQHPRQQQSPHRSHNVGISGVMNTKALSPTPFSMSPSSTPAQPSMLEKALFAVSNKDSSPKKQSLQKQQFQQVYHVPTVETAAPTVDESVNHTQDAPSVATEEEPIAVANVSIEDNLNDAIANTLSCVDISEDVVEEQQLAEGSMVKDEDVIDQDEQPPQPSSLEAALSTVPQATTMISTSTPAATASIDDLADVESLDEATLLEAEIQRMQDEIQAEMQVAAAAAASATNDEAVATETIVPETNEPEEANQVTVASAAPERQLPEEPIESEQWVPEPPPPPPKLQQPQQLSMNAELPVTSVAMDDAAALLEAEIQRMQAEIDAAAAALQSSSMASSAQPSSGRPKKKVLVRKTRKKVRPAVAADDVTAAATGQASTPDATEAPAVAATAAPARPALGFLTDIQNRVKPPNLLADIQKAKRRVDDAEDVVTSESVGARNTVAPRDAAEQSRNLDDEAAQLQAEIDRMQAELAGTVAAPPLKATEPPPPPARPPMFGLLGAIEQAATKRVQRLEETGGELLMQEVAPEVEAVNKGPQQLSTSMAEMISQRAAARDKRLADGGEKRMRKVVIKEKDEYKKDFSNIVTDAAAMGRLTRLNEYTVEAVAQEKTPMQEWKSNGLLAIQWRSNHMAVIHEAAAAGNEFKLPEHVVSNFDEELDEWDPETYGKPISGRMRQLLELSNQVGEGQQKVDKLVLGRKEEQGKPDALLIKPMQAYSNIEDVQLPRKAAPKINPARNAQKLSKQMKEAVINGKPMTDVSASVAEIAWARRARLDRPGSMPKVREVCPCPYCGTASPYQTFAYREQDRKHKEAIMLHRQEQLRKHEERQRILEEARAAGAEMEEEVPAEEESEAEPVDEIERKRRERQRVREETRKLKQALAEAEAAVEAAKASEAAHCQPVAAKPEAPKAAPQSAAVQSTSTPSTATSAVQNRVDQWAAASSPAANSPYAQAPPAEAAGCKCIIM